MSQHLYLPALQKDKSPKIPAESGKWDTNTSRLLLAVSDGIVVDEKARVQGVSSVPDLWARPLTFASALRLQSRGPLRIVVRVAGALCADAAGRHDPHA